MNDIEEHSIDAVMSRMLEPAGLDEGHLNTTLGSMMQGGVDYADLYFQVSRQESWSVEDRIIREGSFSLDQGVGVRAVSGEKTGFAYSDELILPALKHAASAARAIARQGDTQALQAWTRAESALLYPLTDPTTSISDTQKTTLLAEIEASTRALDSRIEQVMISMSSSQDLVLVAGSDGTLAADVRPLVRLNVSVILEEDGRREQGYSSGGARADLGYFLSGEARGGPESCCTRPLATGSRETSTARAHRRSRASSARRFRPNTARLSMTVRCRIGAARCPSMTKEHRAPVMCWARMAFSKAICRTNSMRG